MQTKRQNSHFSELGNAVPLPSYMFKNAHTSVHKNECICENNIQKCLAFGETALQKCASSEKFSWKCWWIFVKTFFGNVEKPKLTDLSICRWGRPRFFKAKSLLLFISPAAFSTLVHMVWGRRNRQKSPYLIHRWNVPWGKLGGCCFHWEWSQDSIHLF